MAPTVASALVPSKARTAGLVQAPARSALPRRTTVPLIARPQSVPPVALWPISASKLPHLPLAQVSPETPALHAPPLQAEDPMPLVPALEPQTVVTLDRECTTRHSKARWALTSLGPRDRDQVRLLLEEGHHSLPNSNNRWPRPCSSRHLPHRLRNRRDQSRTLERDPRLLRRWVCRTSNRSRIVQLCNRFRSLSNHC